MKQKPLRLSVLRDWVDFDVAMHAVGRELGLIPENVHDVASAKAVFWSNNPVGTGLHAVLMQLVQIGYLVHDRNEDRFKLNENFDFEKAALAQHDRKDGTE